MKAAVLDVFAGRQIIVIIIIIMATSIYLLIAQIAAVRGRCRGNWSVQPEGVGTPEITRIQSGHRISAQGRVQ